MELETRGLQGSGHGSIDIKTKGYFVSGGHGQTAVTQQHWFVPPAPEGVQNLQKSGAEVEGHSDRAIIGRHATTTAAHTTATTMAFMLAMPQSDEDCSVQPNRSTNLHWLPQQEQPNNEQQQRRQEASFAAPVMFAIGDCLLFLPHGCYLALTNKVHCKVGGCLSN